MPIPAQANANAPLTQGVITHAPTAVPAPPDAVTEAVVAPSAPQDVMLMAKHVWAFADTAPKKRVKVLAFFDTGAQVTLVTKKLVTALSLR